MDPDSVFAPSGSFEEFRRNEPGEGPDRLAVAERCFSLIDGRPPVRRVVDLSRLGELRGRPLAVALPAQRRDRARGPPAGGSQAAPRGRALELPHGPSLAGMLAAVGALAAARRRGVRREPERRAAPDEPQHPDRAGLRPRGGRLLRDAAPPQPADAYRYAHGEWPGGMTDLRRFFHDVRRRQPLAPLDAREYYVARRGDSIVVLRAGRVSGRRPKLPERDEAQPPDPRLRRQRARVGPVRRARGHAAHRRAGPRRSRSTHAATRSGSIGPDERVRLARSVLEELYGLLRGGHPLEPSDVHSAIQAVSDAAGREPARGLRRRAARAWARGAASTPRICRSAATSS